MKTPIYSRYPAVYEFPLETRSAKYNRLPWALEDLVGTEWCNRYTGRSETVIEIGRNFGGQPSAVYRPPMHGRYHHHIGIWRENYRIENWIRFDHLPPIVRLRWFGVELARLRATRDRDAGRLAQLPGERYRDSCFTANKNMCAVRQVQYAELRIAEATRRMKIWARRHNLDVPLSLINAGENGQLAMF